MSEFYTIALIIIVIIITTIITLIYFLNRITQQQKQGFASKQTEFNISCCPTNINDTVTVAPKELPPEVGSKIGEYTVISQVGLGGMGRIMKAHDPHTNKVVALKIIKSEHLNNQALINRFEQEMKILSMLTHKNIAGILGWGMDNSNRNYFAMEFVDGKNIRNLLENNAINLNLALDIFSQLCTGLQYAHSQNIVHRDIKPDNLILDQDGVLKIVDFGIARADSPESASLTMTNVIMGSPIYMSPEQKSDFKNVDQRADIYAAGAVFYEMLSGEMPGGLLRIDLIPENLRSIVEKSIAYNMKDRYANCADILKDLSSYEEKGVISVDQQAIRTIENHVKLRQALIDIFYPDSIPEVQGIDLDDFYIPAEGIGGNYYDYIKIDDQHTGILVGNLFDQPDVEAALFLAMLRSAFRIFAQESKDPGITLRKLNDFMAGERFDNFAVCSYMVFNGNTKEISVATAGYRPILVQKDNDDKFIEIQPNGVGIGIMEDYDYETSTIQLHTNDLILLSSAGIGKTRNREGVPFGDNRLSELVLSNSKQKVSEIIEGIQNTILYYGAGTAQEDDITVVIAKVT